jgi:hypothetical protein
MMSRNPARSTLIGLILGLWIAASASLIIMIKEGANEVLQNAAGFITGLPTLLFIERMGLPGEWQLQILLFYCALVGAILGWLKGMRRALLWILFILALVTAIVSHSFPELVLEQGLLAAFDYASHVLLIGRGTQ